MNHLNAITTWDHGTSRALSSMGGGDTLCVCVCVCVCVVGGGGHSVCVCGGGGGGGGLMVPGGQSGVLMFHGKFDKVKGNQHAA